MNQRKSNQFGMVYFVGAGPGAPDLITMRGQKIIKTADCIVYAGSLVNKELFRDCKAVLYDSAALHLDEIIEIMAAAVAKGGIVARVHTGDPALYGAIKEQMVRLDQRGIGYQVVPGVSSAFAAAASLGVELTLPEITQSVIITRRAGRTGVPEKEHLAKLAGHGATMVIFLSVGMIEEVVNDLSDGGYALDTPVAVVMRASWPDEVIVRGTLGDIADQVRSAGISKTALICVGDVFGAAPPAAESRLYHRTFSHGCREGGDKT